MPYDEKRKLFTPDFAPDMQQPQWADMGGDQQVNIQPAVGAFQSRFMGSNKGDMSNVPTPTMDNLPMDMGGADASGGAALKRGGMKSL